MHERPAGRVSVHRYLGGDLDDWPPVQKPTPLSEFLFKATFLPITPSAGCMIPYGLRARCSCKSDLVNSSAHAEFLCLAVPAITSADLCASEELDHNLHRSLAMIDVMGGRLGHRAVCLLIIMLVADF